MELLIFVDGTVITRVGKLTLLQELGMRTMLSRMRCSCLTPGVMFRRLRFSGVGTAEVSQK